MMGHNLHLCCSTDTDGIITASATESHVVAQVVCVGTYALLKTRRACLQGHELEHLVATSKLHSDRLMALEANLSELQAAEQEAQDRYAAHIASIDPLKAKYAHHKVRHA